MDNASLGPMSGAKVSLVTTEAAVELIQHSALPTMRNVMLGDATRHKGIDDDVFNAIGRAHEQLQAGAAKITALTRDETRSEPERHHAGGQVAAHVIAELEATKAVLTNRADAYAAAAMATLEGKFTVKPERLFMYDRIAGYIEREAKNNDGGYGRITDAIKTNSDFAMVAMTFPHQLLGMPIEHLTRFRTAAVERWASEVATQLRYSEDLRDLAATYAKTIGRVRLNFHSPTIAAKVNTRVAV